MEELTIERFDGSYTEYHDTFISMLKDYIKELYEFDKGIPLDRDDYTLKQEFLFTPSTYHYFARLNGKVIGFAILGRADNCHPAADVYIEEFYILPEYRKQGIGYKVINHLLSDDNTACYYCLRKNKVARKLWNKVFNHWFRKRDRECEQDSEAFFYMCKRGKRAK